MLHITIKPIESWPGTETKYPKRSQFKQTYRNTLELLEYELDRLNADKDSCEIQMFVREEHLRLDGQLRANQKQFKEGVIFSFDVKKGEWSSVAQRHVVKATTLSYPCDAFDDWHDNVRAIALSLEALRKVARYGVFKYEDIVSRLALPAAGESVTSQSAAEYIAQHSGIPAEKILISQAELTTAYRRAASVLHPDKGGTVEQFQILQNYYNTLKKQ